MVGLPDVYTLRARVLPVVIVTVPIILAVVALIPDTFRTWPKLGIVGALWLVASTLFAQLGRDPGRRRQPGLFASWGGSPTTQKLRHREAQNPSELQRRHELLAAITGRKLPTVEEGEARDPAAADQIYETCVGVVRNQTRDKKKFNVVFEENCNFGLRRNLWGLKRAGIGVASTLLFGVVAYVIGMIAVTGTVENLAPLALVAAGCVIALLGWRFVTPESVGLTGEAYAEALLGACEQLNGTAPKSTPATKAKKRTKGASR